MYVHTEITPERNYSVVLLHKHVRTLRKSVKSGRYAQKILKIQFSCMCFHDHLYMYALMFHVTLLLTIYQVTPLYMYYTKSTSTHPVRACALFLLGTLNALTTLTTMLALVTWTFCGLGFLLSLRDGFNG